MKENVLLLRKTILHFIGMNAFTKHKTRNFEYETNIFFHKQSILVI